MDAAEKQSEEHLRLRRTMRDLVALSTLPAVWRGLNREGIARSLADVLVNTLLLDVVYLSIRGRIANGSTEVVRSRQSANTAQEEAIRAALAPLAEAERDDPGAVISNPLGDGELRVALTRFGLGSDHGALVACSRRPDFPSERDRLLLGVAVNQSAIVIQRQQADEQVQQQREWLQVTLSSIGDAVITTDTEGQITFLNAAAQELTGWSQDEALDQPLGTVFPILSEITREPLVNPVEKVLRHGTIVGLANHTVLIGRNGKEIPIDDSAAPIRNSVGEVIGTVLIFRSVEAQRRAERHRTARLAVTSVLNEAKSVPEGVEGVLRAVCENLAWDVGIFWCADAGKDRLECRSSWHRPHLPVAEFLEASCSRTFACGEGLPGRVWACGEPVWIEEVSLDTNFPRVTSASRYGLHSAFACPLVITQQTLGVIEFFTQRLLEPDLDLLELMGTVAGNLGQFIERKVAEEDLRRSEQELADFFENASVGLHWVGPDGRILRANQAELDLLGYSREEYIGHLISDFHADEDVICDILRKLTAGERLSEYPARLRCKDGSIKNVLIDSSVLWKEGQFIHTRCFTRDVTEQKRAELALSDARSRLGAALEAGAIATWTWDIPRNRLAADSSLLRLFNLSQSDEEDAALETLFESIHPDDRARVRVALEGSLASGGLYEAEYRVVQPDGSVRWVIARGRPEQDEAGRLVRMPGVLVDLTERKTLEQELRLRLGELAEANQRKEELLESLRDADRRKDEFLATLAHELRNPLAPIRNSLQILKLSDPDPETLQETIEMMERQVQHLVRLVDDLLDVSRVMLGKIELRKEPVELADVIARAVETAQPLISLYGHQLHVAVPSESLLVHVDPVRMTQITGNLLTNAAKYSQANGQIWVDARVEEGEAILTVRDSGIGIAPEMLPRIFDLFVQADHATNRSQGGLGIGLTLVKNLVQMHGGTINARSAGLGQGSEFELRLPRKLDHSPDTAQQPKPQERRKAAPTGRRLLVVDDHTDSALSLSRLLRMRGHEVEVAHDGPSGLEKAASWQPHMVLLDIGMPGMDGYEVARRLRQQPGMETVVLAALTGWGQEEDRRRTSQAGFNYHLVKPLEPEALETLLGGLKDLPK